MPPSNLHYVKLLFPEKNWIVLRKVSVWLFSKATDIHQREPDSHVFFSAGVCSIYFFFLTLSTF